MPGVTNWTPLHYAVHKNRIDSARALVQFGADPTARIPPCPALDAATSGARDIDRWTSWGQCHAAHAPNAILPEWYRNRRKEVVMLQPLR